MPVQRARAVSTVFGKGPNKRGRQGVKKLYCAEVSVVTYFYADDKYSAKFEAREAALAEIKNGCSMSISIADSLEEVGEEWHDAIPYGDSGGTDVTPRQWFERGGKP